MKCVQVNRMWLQAIFSNITYDDTIKLLVVRFKKFYESFTGVSGKHAGYSDPYKPLHYKQILLGNTGLSF